MDLVGDVTGTLYMLLSRDDFEKISILIKNISHGEMSDDENYTLSTVAEIGNVLAGVYLTSIHDFSSLTIYHTIPCTAVDMIQSIIDETLVNLSKTVPDIFIFINEFVIKTLSFKMYLLLIPSPDSFDRLVSSLQTIRRGIHDS